MRARILLATLVISGCSYFQSKPETATTPEPAKKPSTSKSASAARITSATELLKAMHDRYDGKYVRTLSFLQNNTSYAPGGQERKSQWYEHLEVPGKLRIAFLPATQKSGLVMVDNKIATFDNGIRVDFRPSINPLLLLTSDVYVAPLASVARDLDSLHVDTEIIRSDEWDGRSVYVVGAKAGDSTTNQFWVDKDNLRLVRFIQTAKAGNRTVVSDTRVKSYKEIEGFDIPTEFLVIRNGRPVWREEYADVRVNQDFPAGTFDQARWNDIPIPKG